jgi:hypothetical protein
MAKRNGGGHPIFGNSISAGRSSRPSWIVATTTSSQGVFRRLLEPEIAGVGGGTADCRGRTGTAGAAAAQRDRDGEKNFRTRKTGRKSLQIARSGRTASPARNGAIELHVRSRKSFCYLQFAIRPARARQRNRGLAGSTGLEPAASGVTGRRSNQLNYDPKNSR